MLSERRLLLLALLILTSACSSSIQPEATEDKAEGGTSDPHDSSDGLPAGALTGRWRFCGLTKSLIQESYFPRGGFVGRIDAAAPGLIATELFPDGGARKSFFRGSYEPTSRSLLGDIWRPHPLLDGSILDIPPDAWTWSDYYVNAVQLTFNSAGNRAQGTVSATVTGAISAGREDGDFACSPIPD